MANLFPVFQFQHFHFITSALSGGYAIGTLCLSFYPVSRISAKIII